MIRRFNLLATVNNPVYCDEVDMIENKEGQYCLYSDHVKLTNDSAALDHMFNRLWDMQNDGHHWLTIPAVLALLNDCRIKANGL